MHLISKLRQDMDKAFRYFSLGMSSRFWVVETTEREREILAFFYTIRPV